jgi:hypothetical protein
MRYASVLYRDYAENSLFTPGAGENNGEFYLPYAKLRERFLATGIELNTPDVNAGRPVEFELHINCRRQDPSARAYVYLYENWPVMRSGSPGMEPCATTRGRSRSFTRTASRPRAGTDPRSVRCSACSSPLTRR